MNLFDEILSGKITPERLPEGVPYVYTEMVEDLVAGKSVYTGYHDAGNHGGCLQSSLANNPDFTGFVLGDKYCVEAWNQYEQKDYIFKCEVVDVGSMSEYIDDGCLGLHLVDENGNDCGFVYQKSPAGNSCCSALSCNGTGGSVSIYNASVVKKDVTRGKKLVYEVMPDEYPGIEKRDTVLFDEDITITNEYWDEEDGGFEYGFEQRIGDGEVFAKGRRYDITFMGETFEVEIETFDNFADITCSNGVCAEIYNDGIFIYHNSDINPQPPEIPFTTRLKVVEHYEILHQLPKKYIADALPPNVGPIYGECKDQGNVSNKNVYSYHGTSYDVPDRPIAGTVLIAKFTYSNSVSNPKLILFEGVSSYIYDQDGNYIGNKLTAGIHILVYDGNKWFMIV